MLIRLFFALAILCSSVYANEKACEGDAAKLCAGKHWKEGLGNCLIEHQGQLSPECAAKVAEFESKHPCKADAVKLCGAKKWHDGLAKCLKEKKGQLSPGCAEKMAHHHDSEKK